MVIVDRRCVGTEPTIRIGRRQYRQRDGSIATCRTWCAKWCYRGRPGFVSLRTLDAAVAAEKAVQLRTRLLSSEDPRLQVGVTFTILRERYLEYQRQRNHAPRTIQK